MPTHRRAVATLILVTLTGCVSDDLRGMPHHWVDEQHGFRVHSDYEPRMVELTFARHIAEQRPLLDAALGPVSLDDIDVVIHREPPPDRGGFVFQGLHVPERIDVWSTSVLEIPDFGSRDVLVHELVHAYAHAHRWDLPRWLDEGLANHLTRVVRDADGELVSRRHAESWAFSVTRRGGEQDFDVDELLACDEDYPAAERIGAFYGFATTFVDSLIEQQTGSLAERIATVRALDDDALREAATVWRAQLEAGALLEHLAARAATAGPALREALAADLYELVPLRDATWWHTVHTLCRTGDDGVVRTLLLAVNHLHGHGLRDGDRAALEAMATDTDPTASAFGHVGLALTVDAAHAPLFVDLVLLDDERFGTFAQALLWIQFALPRDGERRPDFGGYVVGVDLDDALAVAGRMSAWLDEHGADLELDTTVTPSRYRWRDPR